MAESATIISNERWKACSSVSLNLGSALFAAGVVQMWVKGGATWEGATWLLAAIVLIWVGWMFLGLLAAET